MLLSYLTIMMPNPNARLTLPRDEGLLKAFTAPQEHFHVQILFRVYVCPTCFIYFPRDFLRSCPVLQSFSISSQPSLDTFHLFLHITVVAQHQV